MANNNFPYWLTSFDLVIQDMDREILFDKYSNSLEDINFDDGDGFIVGSHIFIKNKEYIVLEMHVICAKDENGMPIRLEVFVEKKSD